MTQFRFFPLVAAIIFSFSSYAETTGEEIWRDFSSPVTTKAWVPLSIGTGTTLFFYGFKYEIGDPLQDSWSTRKPLGSASKFGDLMGQMVPNALYSLGMAIDGWGYHNDKAKKRAILMLKASVYSGVMAQVVKYMVREPRPNGSSDMASFPSGHATSAFAFASVVGAEHEWYWGVAAYSLAAFVGASRINDNMHRLHDVIGGATLGLSYGLGLYYRSHPDETSDGRKASNTVYQILPTDDMSGAIVTMFREF